MNDHEKLIELASLLAREHAELKKTQAELEELRAFHDKVRHIRGMQLIKRVVRDAQREELGYE